MFDLVALKPLLVHLISQQAGLVHCLGLDPPLHAQAMEELFAAARAVT